MSKKFVSLLLVLSILFSLFPARPARAAESREKPEYIQGEFEYRLLGDESIRTMRAWLGHNSDIYVTVNDAASLAGFEVVHDDTMYIFSRITEPIWSYLNLRMSEDGICYDNQTVPYYDAPDGSRWYSLMPLLHYLRAQFVNDDRSEDDVAVISRAENHDILSVWLEYGYDIEAVQLSQKDLYHTYGKLYQEGFRSTLSIVVDGGIDWRVIVPKWGEDAIVQDQYEEALLTLAEEDSNYIIENEDEFKQIAEGFPLELSAPWVSELHGLFGLPESLDDLYDMLQEADQYAAKVIKLQTGGTMDPLNIYKTAFSEMGWIDVGLEVFSLFHSYMEIAERSSVWKDDFLRGLELLETADAKHFKNNGAVTLLSAASTMLLEEYRDPIRAAEGAVWEEGLEFFVKTGLSMACPLGAFFGIADTCLGAFDLFAKKEISMGTATYLLDCLLNIQSVVTYYMNREISSAFQEAGMNGCVSQERLNRIRSWILLSLRATQRSYSLAYSLEMTKNQDYKNTPQAAAYRTIMNRAFCLLCNFNDTSRFDGNLTGSTASPMISDEPYQVRDELTEPVWLTCLVGGAILLSDLNKLATGAVVEIYRSDAPDKVFTTVTTDEQGRWECSLDNRYDYTFTVHAKDEDGQEFSPAHEHITRQQIDEEENYIDFVTVLTHDREELFYEYLRKNVVPEIGTCDGASFKTLLENKDMAKGGGTGLLSALVDDLDGDGSQEMVTVTVSAKEITDNMIASLVYKVGRPVVSVDLDLYELVNGEVVHADGPRNIGYMERLSYGTIEVSACQWDGITYFFGKSKMDDLTTYGPTAIAIYHPEDGKLVFDVVSGGGWGQSLPGTDDNAKMHTRNTDFRDTALQTSHMELLSALKFDLDFVTYSNSNVDVTIHDETFLEEALENTYKSIEERAKALLKQLDQDEQLAREEIEEEQRRKEAAMNSPAVKTAQKVIDDIQAASGITLSLLKEELGEDGSYSVRYKTGDKARLYITTDASGTITSISVEARTYTQTAEWISLKDVILNLKELSLSSDAIGAFSGKLSRQSINETRDGYKITVHNVDNFFIGLTKQ
ncbi:MAG: hypothetical protein IJM90_01655 [Firmicutes bacterium]|nr:hypothetical protein [Bacillota bacterium]